MATISDRLPRLAVLIDADNATANIADALFAEVAKIGEASVRRIYGDFSGTRLKGWADVLPHHAIIPQQIPPNIKGKNASDIALVIDAMDLLHSARFDAFCLVSSDSDFTRLAARIREQGVDVLGFGKQTTPVSFRKACKKFIYLENLEIRSVKQEPRTVEPVKVASSGQEKMKRPISDALPIIGAALDQLEDNDGWYSLGSIGARLAILIPDFDTRTYGCSKLLPLVEKSGAFEIRRDGLHVQIRPDR